MHESRCSISFVDGWLKIYLHFAKPFNIMIRKLTPLVYFLIKINHIVNQID